MSDSSAPVSSADALRDVTYWITRDRKLGELVNVVDVWLVCPQYFRLDDGDLYWVAPVDMVDRAAAYYDTWTLKHAHKHARVVPEHELECIRVGADFDSLEGLRRPEVAAP